MLAQKMEAEVEKPLRDYQNKNKAMQGLNTIQGNLAAMSKELEEAQKRSEKLQAKGGKADLNKVSSAISSVQDATQQWESQAPFVFEQLQAVDESRINHLRDVLTQFQTQEVDQLERNRATAEICLNALLNVDTKEEISTFVARTSEEAPALRRPSRSAHASTPPTATSSNPMSLAPISPPLAVQHGTDPSTLTSSISRSVDEKPTGSSVAAGGSTNSPSSELSYLLIMSFQLI